MAGVLEMDELLAKVETGKIKGIYSDGAGVRYGVRRKWSRSQDKHKGEREAMLTCVWGDSEGESSCTSVEQATGGGSSLHGAAPWQARWKERALLLWMADMEEWV